MVKKNLEEKYIADRSEIIFKPYDRSNKKKRHRVIRLGGGSTVAANVNDVTDTHLAGQ